MGIAARFYSALAALSGDEGARQLLAARASSVQLIEVDDAGILRDIDVPADLSFPTDEFAHSVRRPRESGDPS